MSSKKSKSKKSDLESEIELRKSDNPYKIKLNEPLDEEESLERQLRFVLNRLTPQNFQKLLIDLLNLPINSEEKLRHAVDIIYDKSLNDLIYNHLYALACKMMSEIKVPFEHISTQFISFLTILLKKCEREFDADFHKDKYYEYLLQEAESCQDQSEKKELYKKADEQIDKAKLNYIANVKFMGELYKMGLIEEAIINECIEKLFNNEQDEENLECLCKLFTTIGREYDKLSNKNRMDQYMDKLKRLSEQKDLISPRIRFIILDLLELRDNKWVPIHFNQLNKPRRIDEIRREFEIEQEKKMSELVLNQEVEDKFSKVEFGMCEGLRYSLYYGYAHHILEEYIKNKNVEHVLNDFNQLKLIQHSNLIEALFILVLDKNEHDRECLGEMFYISLKQKKLNLHQFIQGIRNVLKNTTESLTEEPKVPFHMGQILACLFHPDFINLHFFKQAFEPIIDRKYSADLIIEILRSASKRVGQQTVCDILELSDLDINMFMSCFKTDEDKIDYLKEKQVDWIVHQNEHIKQVLEAIQSFKKRLDVILENSSLDNEDLIAKIEKEFDVKEIDTKEFIRALIISLLKSCMLNKKLDETKFINRALLLRNFIEDKEEKELQILYSVQIFDFQMRYQPGFITNVFSILHGEDVIREEAFWKWKKNPLGKGHAISEFILKNFFQWLSEQQHEE